ncbi:MAG: MMPL family transporter [Desulfocapsaceae bacterium]|nr:MMPL family transporter [Desulfocapsaceae bacterium]
MREIFSLCKRCYLSFLNHPVLIVIAVLLVSLLATYYTRHFSFDASEDTLVAEGDPDLEYYRQVSANFPSQDFLFLTYTPKSGTIFTQATLSEIDRLTTTLKQVNGVKAVSSILDAPLFRNPPVPINKVAENFKTLRADDVDLELAAQELTTSPFFRELLISVDGRTTALRVDLVEDPELDKLHAKRNKLRQQDNLSGQDQQKLAEIEELYRSEREQSLTRRDATLDEIRQIRDDLGGEVVIHLGGIPLIASNMVEYVKRDITFFGLTVLTLTSIMLLIIFRQLRWVLLPLMSTGIAITIAIGLLGFLRQPTTVISSNFISLIAIINISLSIHLIVRFRELKAKNQELSHRALVFQTMTDKFAPCAYTALTTMVAFASLITSEIVPVMDFGWIMCTGIAISFLVTYSFFAAVLLLFSGGNAAITSFREPRVSRFFGQLSIRHTTFILGLAATSCVVAVFGINRVSLDNRFMDYFRSGTEIHKGLYQIDKYLGGTIPLDIILHLPPYSPPNLDEESDFFTEVEDVYPERYWFTPDKFAYLQNLHAYLDEKPEIGKTLSILTLKQLGETITDGEPLGSLELMGAFGALPEDVRREIIAPFASPESGLIRLSARVHETGPPFSHSKLLADIDRFTKTELGIAPESVRLTGMEVLFNGMLKHLFDSQKSTLIFVIGATFLMFVILLRSIRLAVLGLLPNVMSAAVILAFMGFVGIPLDLMTITIAAIIIGIGVDDAIHYLHRFKKEVTEVEDVETAIANSHSGIGSALYYTSFTVVIGFSVLSFSNFIPTVYFGLLTSLAMIGALLANLLVLPSLLLLTGRGKYVREKNLEKATGNHRYSKKTKVSHSVKQSQE